MGGYSRIYRLCALFLAVALLLAVPSCAPGERIKTPLTPGEHVQEVELSDGFLFFNEGNPLTKSMINIPTGSILGGLTREYAMEVLGFDPEVACASLPEHLQFTWDDLPEETFFYPLDDGSLLPAIGLAFQKVGDPAGSVQGEPACYGELTLFCNLYTHNPRGAVFPHAGADDEFYIVPWNRAEEFFDRFHVFTDVPSMVGDLEVGICYDYVESDLLPDCPDLVYYAGFYVGDRAYGLECHYDYCTQEEFIQVLLAIIDAAVAAENGTPTATQEG